MQAESLETLFALLSVESSTPKVGPGTERAPQILAIE